MRHLPFEDLGFAKVDHHRAARHGMPEVIFAKGKTPEQVVAIATALLEHAPNVLITRADAAVARSGSGTESWRRAFPAFRRHSFLARPHV